MVTLSPNPDGAIGIDSNVKASFGESIEASVREILAKLDMKEAAVRA